MGGAPRGDSNVLSHPGTIAYGSSHPLGCSEASPCSEYNRREGAPPTDISISFAYYLLLEAGNSMPYNNPVVLQTQPA